MQSIDYKVDSRLPAPYFLLLLVLLLVIVPVIDPVDLPRATHTIAAMERQHGSKVCSCLPRYPVDNKSAGIGKSAHASPRPKTLSSVR